jgi:hypothetical protein
MVTCRRKKNISGLFQSQMGLFHITLSRALPEALKLKLNESGPIRRRRLWVCSGRWP